MTNKMVGIEWMKCLMKRHTILRKPESMSLFVQQDLISIKLWCFLSNYETELQRGNFSPDRIYRLEETIIMTVVQTPNVIAKTRQK